MSWGCSATLGMGTDRSISVGTVGETPWGGVGHSTRGRKPTGLGRNGSAAPGTGKEPLPAPHRHRGSGSPFQCISLFLAHSLCSAQEMTHRCAHACTQSRAFYCEKSEAGGRKGPTGTAPAQVSGARRLLAREGKRCNPLRDKQRGDVTATVVMATL